MYSLQNKKKYLYDGMEILANVTVVKFCSVYVYEINTAHSLNLHNVLSWLYLNKAREKKENEYSALRITLIFQGPNVPSHLDLPIFGPSVKEAFILASFLEHPNSLISPVP